ncbi:MAG: DUF4381 family protein [Myxococcota bacterium]
MSLATMMGCARGLASQAAGGAVDESLEEAAEAEGQRDLGKILSNPEVRQATRELSRSVVQGAIVGLTEDERLQGTDPALDGFATEVAAEVGAAATGAIVTTLSEQLPELTETTLDQLGSDGSREQLAAVTRTVTTAVLEAFAAGLRTDVGPALRQVIATDVALGTRAALDGGLGEAVGDTARIAGRNFVIGSEDGLVRVLGDEQGALSIVLARTLGQGAGLAPLVFWGLALVAALLVAGLVWAVVRLRRARAEAREQREATRLLMTAFKAAEKRPWSEELQAVLRQEMRDREGAEHVRRLLRDHPELRMERPNGPPATAATPPAQQRPLPFEERPPPH